MLEKMTPDLQKEFAAVADQARQQLKSVPESGSYNHVFSTWVFPSFAPSYRWTVYSPRPFTKGKKAFASFTIWRSDLDLQKFNSPIERLRFSKEIAPSVEEEVVWLTESEVEELVSRLRGVSIPVFVSASVVGCDGTSFEFRYDEFFFGMTLHWWEDHPAEWRPFTEVVRGIDHLLQLRKKESNKAPGPKP